MPKSTRSHHLKVLRECGVVRSEPRGRERLLSLRREDLESRFPGLLVAVLAEEPALG
jgi:DNA-binding transcriptional ArsR family regulator